MFVDCHLQNGALFVGGSRGGESGVCVCVCVCVCACVRASPPWEVFESSWVVSCRW